MAFNHLTFEVPRQVVEKREMGVAEFLLKLGFVEVPAGEEADWPVRWFDSDRVQLHLVGRHYTPLGLGHFCVEVGRRTYAELRDSHWCVRNRTGSHRIWLEAYGLRVEVRSNG